jgi:hypothetical protein
MPLFEFKNVCCGCKNSIKMHKHTLKTTKTTTA